MPRITINNIQLYYETFGEGEPILFIHGLGSSTRDWEKQTAFFSRHFQVIVLDLRGHGQSDKPSSPYSIPLFANDVAELIRSLKVSPAHIVGISLGAMIGMQLAVDEPQLVKSLVAVNSPADMRINTFRQRFELWLRQVVTRLLGMRVMGKILSKRLFPEPSHAALRNRFIEQWAENSPHAYRQTINAIVGWHIHEHLAAIHCPVLVVAADEDYWPLEMKASIARQVKRGNLVVIENSHHAVTIERPDQFNQTVAQFLQTT